MKGHIRERSPGHWAIVIDLRDTEAGKRRRRWYSFRGTKRQAQVECARLISEIQNGTAIEPSRLTVSDFLERWIEHMQGQVSPRSHERYAEIARKNLMPLLGGLALTKLQPAHISQAYAKALTSGRRDGKGGLSARTVTHMHRVLREALQQAVRWQLLAGKALKVDATFGTGAGAIRIGLRRSRTTGSRTRNQALWVSIRNRTKVISF